MHMAKHFIPPTIKAYFLLYIFCTYIHVPTHFIGKASPAIIKSGDYVQVQVELAEFQRMQEGHGGWAGQMSEVRDLYCIVA